MEINMQDRDPVMNHKLLTGLVAPRPIGWISTIGQDGVLNLAPYSFFNVVSSSPATLMFSGGRRDGVPKDSVINAVSSGEFVVNLASRALMHEMNQTSIESSLDHDEFAFAGLQAAPSTHVAPPRVAAAPVAFECTVVHTYEIPNSNTVVFGQVQVAHVRDDLMLENGRVDTRALDPLARLAGTAYATLGEILDVERP
jgi:flavin reductase (DIM6/NTAB) family NADH-FMN oxidoreductase RutF